MTDHRLADFARSLIANGFRVENVRRTANYACLHTCKRDEFGALARHLFVVTEASLGVADLASVEQMAIDEGCALVLVSDSTESSTAEQLTFSEFYGRLGGNVRSYLVLEDYYSEHLKVLGFNKLPAGLTGVPSDLFEEYVGHGLEFIFNQRVVRYGRKRSGKELPDGLLLGNVIALYDCKAAAGFYDFDTDTMRQFASYVTDFRNRYAGFGLTLTSFIIVSGAFKDAQTITDRSADLYSRCQLRMVAIDVESLSAIIDCFIAAPQYRRLLDWPRLLARDILTLGDIQANLAERKKDGIV